MKLKNKEAKRSQSFTTIIYETYKDFAENTSIHGLKYTVMKEINAWEKLFWAIVLLSGLFTSIYLTFLFWERYVGNPTRTTIMSYYAPTISIEFPAITICNINRILDSKIDTFMETLQMNESEAETFKKTLPQILTMSNVTAAKPEMILLQDILERNNINSMSYLMKSISQNCSETVKFCTWSNEPIECSKIFNESLTSEGYCCSFNYGSTEQKFRHTEYNGLGTGIVVILDPMLQPVQHTFFHSSGFRVSLHDPSEYPGFQSTTKLISAGTVAFLQIYGRKIICSAEVKKLQISQRHCHYSDEFQLRSFDEYSESNCLTECQAYYYYEKCGCVPYYLGFIGKTQCNLTKLPCVLDIHWADLDTKKICNCPAQCEDDHYTVISEHSTFNFDESMSMMNLGNTTIKEDSILLNAFFNEQTQTIYLRDTIFSTIYLLSSFGGVYSLFMGCSLITVVEIIYYCIVRFFVNMKLLGSEDVDIETTKKNKREVRTIYNEKVERYLNSTFLP